MQFMSHFFVSFELQVQRPARSPPTSAIGSEEPQTCRPVSNLKPLMRGPMGKVPEGLLSRNECIGVLLRQAVHDSLNVFVEIGLPHLCRLAQSCHWVDGTRRARQAGRRSCAPPYHTRVTAVSGPSSCVCGLLSDSTSADYPQQRRSLVTGWEPALTVHASPRVRSHFLRLMGRSR